MAYVDQQPISFLHLVSFARTQIVFLPLVLIVVFESVSRSHDGNRGLGPLLWRSPLDDLLISRVVGYASLGLVQFGRLRLH